MKKECYLCTEELEVDEKCEEVICDACLLAGQPPVGTKNGIIYYTQEAFDRILGEYKPEIETWETAQKMRDQGLSLRKIAERLETSKDSIQRHTVSSNV